MCRLCVSGVCESGVIVRVNMCECAVCACGVFVVCVLCVYGRFFGL